MCVKGILLVIISLGIIVHATENNLMINSVYPLELRMMNLESELKSDATESSYTRVIVWNTMPNSEDLQHYFNKFGLLQLSEIEITSGKLDIIGKNESSYERFLYAYFAEQQSAVTIFFKVNFNNKRNSVSLGNFIEKVNATLKKHGLIDKNVIVHDQIRPDNSTSWNTYIDLIVIIICKVSSPYLVSFCNKSKNMGHVNYNRNDNLGELRKDGEKLTVQRQSLSANRSDLAMTPVNIGNMCYNMDDYDQALSSYKEARIILEKSLPSNDLVLAMIINNIGAVHESMKDDLTAEPCFEDAIQTLEQSSSKSYHVLAEYKKRP